MKSKLLTLMLTLCAALCCSAQAPDPYDDYDEAAFMDMDLDQNIETPAIDKREAVFIRTYMRKLATELEKRHFIVDLDRNDEVVVLTVPAEKIFLPNDTLLAPFAESALKPMLGYLKNPDTFKLVYTVNTDDTGSPSYLRMLSQERANTLYDWLLHHVSEDQVIIPYSMENNDPIETNDTREGRAINRRVEFYLIPGPELILKARKK